MKNILEKNKPTETIQTEKPRTVIASKLTKIKEFIDRDGNVIRREVTEAK